ncbi:MAG: glycosyltransferase family 2 protein [Candidatus Omnitrophica bacterium]|nr:glycosyltransferase family 2 protein [Candidatus Omnitrophota bacterium]MBU4477866.1 glycosyltransferase family 2 protein [Candidatus Omnitrophota bacterium]MCG2704138.1 glycosyltransferase family 2 protein [Candidatus Omnitrophota bacterium]
MKISIIIPVFNEEGNLEILNNRINAVIKSAELDCEVIFIDDGSIDGSAAALEQICKENKHVKVITLAGNYGQTQAIAAGVDNAAGEFIITLDADLQNDPVDIPNIIAKLDEGYDVVSGWRVKRKDNLFTKKIPSYLANRLSVLITNVRLHDLGCTLKGYRKTVLEKIEFYGEIHRFLPICAAMYGAKITEIPVEHHPRTNGKSKYGFSRGFKAFLDILAIIFLWKFITKPIYAFGGIGLFSLAISALIGVFIVARKLLLGGLWVSPLLFLFVIFSLMGIQFILMGILAELVIRLCYGVEGKKRYRVKEIRDNGC